MVCVPFCTTSFLTMYTSESLCELLGHQHETIGVELFVESCLWHVYVWPGFRHPCTHPTPSTSPHLEMAAHGPVPVQPFEEMCNHPNCMVLTESVCPWCQVPQLVAIALFAPVLETTSCNGCHLEATSSKCWHIGMKTNSGHATCLCQAVVCEEHLKNGSKCHHHHKVFSRNKGTCPCDEHNVWASLALYDWCCHEVKCILEWCIPL